MIPIAASSLVTADQLSCRLAAVDDHACPEGASTAPNDLHSPAESQPESSLRPSSAGLALLATARTAPTNTRCTPRSQPNPHSAR